MKFTDNKVHQGKFFMLKKLIGIVSLVSLLVACSEQRSVNVLEMAVTSETFVINAKGRGQIKAIDSTDISTPREVVQSQVIAWIAPENTFVKKGDVVLRFDEQKYVHDIEREEFEIAKANIDFISKQLALNVEADEISNELRLVDDELQLAGQYSVNDLRVFSKNDIIDNMQNLSFLQAKQDFSQWRSDGHKEKSVSELELLQFKANEYKGKLERHQKALKQLVVKAPHDGIFILESNWRGEKPRVGQTVWPGHKVASLPNLSKLQAKIAIPESEAMGIKVGQRVELVLDAEPDTIIRGSLKQIDSVAKPQNNKNPVKFFEALVTIDDNNGLELHPGSHLSATVFVAEKADTISIPNQAIHSIDGQHYVYRLDGDWQRQSVKLGLRGISRTEITEGLSVRDTISLITPGDNNAAD